MNGKGRYSNERVIYLVIVRLMMMEMMITFFSDMYLKLYIMNTRGVFRTISNYDEALNAL